MDKKISILLPFEIESKIDFFQKKEVQKVLYDGEWWFSVKDTLEAVTDTTDGTRKSRGPYHLNQEVVNSKQSL